MLMQSQRDASHILQLGGVRGKVIVTGNLKYDMTPPDEPENISSFVKQVYAPDTEIIVAGSTSAGEETIILDVFVELCRKHFSSLDGSPKKLRLILAPRHPERWNEVENLIKSFGLSYIRRTFISSDLSSTCQVILLDTIGELAFLYSIASIVFVGGSLIPAGGHNILEPAVFGKPIIVGPYTHNIQEMVSEFLEARAIVQLRIDPKLKFTEQLVEAFSSLLIDKSKSQTMGEAARALVERNRGATNKTLLLISSLINQPIS
jgi:3-deoxy-D-manno-octulosonic-acid transferase